MPNLYINKVEIAGNLTADPVLENLPTSDAAVCNVTVATNVFIKNNDPDNPDEFDTITQFHKVTLFRYDAEKLASRAKKGSNIHLYGHLEHSKYEDKLTGVIKYSTTIIGKKLTVLGHSSDRDKEPTEFPYADPMYKHRDFIKGLGPRPGESDKQAAVESF